MTGLNQMYFGVFLELLLKKKIKIFLYIFEESFFSHTVAICHLFDMVEEDRLYNSIIVWQGSIRGVWSFSRITKKKKSKIFYIFLKNLFFQTR